MYGKKIKDLRKKNGMTQAELAELLGFKSASAIGMIERDERNISPEMFPKLSQIFSIPVDYFFTDAENSKENKTADQLDKDIKSLYPRMKKLTPEERKKILKMLDILLGENDLKL